MQPRNILIHIVVAFAALHAAVLANPVQAVVPAPAGAAHADADRAYPAWAVVAYPEGDVLVFAPADAAND